MAEERTLVQLQDIVNTEPMDIEARKLGGKINPWLEGKESAVWGFPTRSAAHDFMFIARQRGYGARLLRGTGPLGMNPLDALREDAERIRRMLKKPGPKPPWAK